MEHRGLSSRHTYDWMRSVKKISDPNNLQLKSEQIGVNLEIFSDCKIHLLLIYHLNRPTAVSLRFGILNNKPCTVHYSSAILARILGDCLNFTII